jgi:ComF family protein
MRDLLLKQSCILCASHQGGSVGICDDCLQDLPWHTQPQCPQCAMLSNGLICGNCLNSVPHFDATHALFRYDYPLDKLLQHYKYHESLHLANTFSVLWLKKFRLNIFEKAQHTSPLCNIELIIPMPMHPERLKQRGFNQALEIARILSLHSRMRLDYESCHRIKLTQPQASLPLKHRMQNIRGAFRCEKNLEGKRIAVVDDVMTSGASLNELAKTLKQAGAAHVECWVIARTLPKSN